MRLSQASALGAKSLSAHDLHKCPSAPSYKYISKKFIKPSEKYERKHYCEIHFRQSKESESCKNADKCKLVRGIIDFICNKHSDCYCNYKGCKFCALGNQIARKQAICKPSNELEFRMDCLEGLINKIVSQFCEKAAHKAQDKIDYHSAFSFSFIAAIIIGNKIVASPTTFAVFPFSCIFPQIGRAH